MNLGTPFYEHLFSRNTSGGCFCKSLQFYSNKTALRVFFVNFVKILETFFLIHCINFLKVLKNTDVKMFAKYLSADCCFVTTIVLLTVMITAILSVS